MKERSVHLEVGLAGEDVAEDVAVGVITIIIIMMLAIPKELVLHELSNKPIPTAVTLRPRLPK